MRRFAITAALLVPRSPFRPPPPRRRPARARLLACDSALDPADRMATFEGRMRTVRGATRLQMRFTLQTRGKGQVELARAAGPRLRQVAEQRPRRRPLRLHQARRGAARAGVLPHARALPLDRARRQAHRLGPRDLARPAARPTCAPTCARSRSTRAAGPTPRTPATSSRSSTAARPRPGRSTSSSRSTARRSPPAQTPGLEPGERALVEVEGPPCTVGSMLTVDVDPTGAVDERAEADNRLDRDVPRRPGLSAGTAALQWSP